MLSYRHSHICLCRDEWKLGGTDLIAYGAKKCMAQIWWPNDTTEGAQLPLNSQGKKTDLQTRIVIVAMFTKSQERQRHSVAGESPLKVDPLLRKITIRLGTGRASGSSSRHREGSREVAACFTGPLKRLQKMEFWPVHHQNHQESSSSWDSTLVQKNN